MKRFVFLVLSLIALRANCALESVPELENAMYKALDGKACVRLLDLYGEIGCANPGRDKITAPIHRLTTLEIRSKDPVAVLLPYPLLHIFLEKTVIEPSFAKHVAGVLVEFEENSNATVYSNPEKTFPQAEFAPYGKKDYIWNPSGTGVLHKRYNFPVYLLSRESTSILRKAADENQARNGKFPVKVAEFNFIMQTTKLGTHTSASCLKAGSCLPLGGYSVWSAVPPINMASIASRAKPILLAVAAMDSASLFRDLTPGADSPISGLIALLAAADAISKVGGISNARKQVVFLVCAGEAWGYLGSRRFLLELETGQTSVTGLNASEVHQILEVGSVGLAAHTTFFAHSHEASPAVQEIHDALRASAQWLQADVKMADKRNPGVPPSSLMAFLQKNSSLAGVVLEEFDTALKNKFYHSDLDNDANVHVEAITTAASVLSRTIYQLASSDDAVPDSLVANSSLVTELVSCLLTADPGMGCELVKSLMTPTEAVPNHYVGVVLDTIDDTSQFVWNFLADRTKQATSQSTECSQKRQCEDPSHICLGGKCTFSTTRYVPAYSTRLKSRGSKGWELLPVDAGDVMGSVDPVWTESFWDDFSVRVYLQDDPSLDVLIFLLGLGITTLSVIATLATKAVLGKRLKLA